jgi:hypothetical protein
MGKSSIELTLKQLIDLGIINLKKKRKNKKQKRVKRLQQIQNEVFSPLKSSSDHLTKGYSTPFHLPVLNQNTDALRLRDAQAELNTRQLEQKLLLEDAKQGANDFQQKTKDAFQYVFNTITNPSSSGYTEDDGVGAFGAVGGSDSFRPMRDIQPDTAIKMGDYPTIQEIDDEEPEENTPLINVERQPQIQSPQQDQTPIKSKSLFGLVGLKNPFKNTKLFSPAMLDSMEEPARSDSGDFDETDSVDAFGYNQPYKPLPERPTLVNSQGFRLPEVILQPSSAGGGGKQAGGTPQQPIQQKEVSSGDYQHINKSTKKPTKSEIQEWKSWYEDLAGDNTDSFILSSNKRSVIEPAIIKILLKEYKSVGGDNSKILKSKDSKEVAREITKLKRLNKILA